jgi:hypothetical protein
MRVLVPVLALTCEMAIFSVSSAIAAQVKVWGRYIKKAGGTGKPEMNCRMPGTFTEKVTVDSTAKVLPAKISKANTEWSCFCKEFREGERHASDGQLCQ